MANLIFRVAFMTATKMFIGRLNCPTLFSKFSIILRINPAQMSSTTPTKNNTKCPRLEPVPLCIGTHSGFFHCDEILACFMLKQLPEYENCKIIRSRNNEELFKSCDIVVDVGGEFDHKKKLYDHHQKSFQETMSSLRPEMKETYNIRLSSAGLIYCFYGERVINEILKKHGSITLSAENLMQTYKQVYSSFIIEIDGIDNGVPICPNGEEPLYKISTSLSSRVAKFNINWEDVEDNDDENARFEEAMKYAGKEFVEIVLSIGGSWIRAREYVRRALETAKTVHESGEILLLEKCCPWKHHLSTLEKEYQVEGMPKLVIFRERSGEWRLVGVPVHPDSFLGRKFLPEPWRGCRDEDLSQLAGIEGLRFVHQTGFTGGAKTKKAVLAMAIKSLQWNLDVNSSHITNHSAI